MSHVQIFPIDFIVQNPCTLYWSSKPFYSHTQGYRLRLILSNTLENCTVSCDLLPGEFDNLLKWPLKAVMELELRPQKGHCMHLYMDLNQKKCAEDGVMVLGGCGSKLIVGPFTNKNSLCIKIVGVKF